MNQAIQINDWDWDRLISPRFRELVDNRDRILIMYGGRGSGKSDFAAKKIIFRMLTEEYVRCVLVRSTYNSIKDTQWQSIKDIIYSLGLESLFTFTLNPLSITCVNGNTVLARGLDDVTRLKSLMNPSLLWVEEDFMSETEWITLSTSIRTTQATYLQEMYTINAEVEGDHTTHWFWKRFFEGHDQLSFRDTVRTEVAPGVDVDLSYTVHHSTYHDNPWISQQFVGQLEDLKRTNPYYYQCFCLGRWGHRQTTGQFIKQFSMTNNVQPTNYNPVRPLWCSFDFNSLPGVSCILAQHENGLLQIIDSIQLSAPHNNTAAVCREVIRKYGHHKGGMYVTGDSSGRHEDTRTERGYNDYSIIMGALREFEPSNVTPKTNPPIVPRRNFIDNIFQAHETGYKGVRIIIDPKCGNLINDLLYALEASDGTMLKQKTKDHKTGASYEKYGHLLDAFSYAVCSMVATAFENDKRGGVTGVITYGKNISRNNDWGSSSSGRHSNYSY